MSYKQFTEQECLDRKIHALKELAGVMLIVAFVFGRPLLGNTPLLFLDMSNGSAPPTINFQSASDSESNKVVGIEKSVQTAQVALQRAETSNRAVIHVPKESAYPPIRHVFPAEELLLTQSEAAKARAAALESPATGARETPPVPRPSLPIANVEKSQCAWGNGVHGLWSGKYDEAVSQFQTALKADPANPAAAYFLALGYRRQGKLQDATDALTLAVQLERSHELPNYGRIMERVQGKDRMWIEAARQSTTN